MSILFKGATALACLAVLSACSSLITGGDLIRPGEATGIIEVVNNTSDPLHAVLISECNASTYGLNRLPENTVIPSGGSFQFTVSAGCWDVDGGTLGVGEARQRMTVAGGGITRYTING
jgi:hypothetical protein